MTAWKMTIPVWRPDGSEVLTIVDYFPTWRSAMMAVDAVWRCGFPANRARVTAVRR